MTSSKRFGLSANFNHIKSLLHKNALSTVTLNIEKMGVFFVYILFTPSTVISLFFLNRISGSVANITLQSQTSKKSDKYHRSHKYLHV